MSGPPYARSQALGREIAGGEGLAGADLRGFEIALEEGFGLARRPSRRRGAGGRPDFRLGQSRGVAASQQRRTADLEGGERPGRRRRSDAEAGHEISRWSSRERVVQYV